MPDIEVTKRAIEAQLDDYEREITEFAAYMEWWRSQQPTRLFSDEIQQQPAEAAE